jgi:hypothetical protein
VWHTGKDGTGGALTPALGSAARQPFGISMLPMAQTHVCCAALLTLVFILYAVFDTPGHTRGHITLSFPQASAVFPGGPYDHNAAADQQ